MSSTPPSGGILFVESLEPRIAPTGLVAISGDPAINATNDSRYVTFQTPPSAGHLGFVPASQYGINVPNVFAIKLTGNGTFDAATGTVSTGDELVVFNNVTGFNFGTPLIQANSGTVVAFFLDRNAIAGGNPALAGQVFADELVGVSVGKKGVLTINGNVHGDIVTNLNGAGTAVSSTNLGKPSFGISGLTMSGNVFGDILSNGNIKNIQVVGSVDNILAGTATNAVPIDFSGGTAAPTGAIVAGTKINHPGANINQVVINTLAPNGRIQSGDGGFAAVGGAVTNVTLNSDTDAFSVLSGAGGNGDVGILGGTGGIISGLTVVGAAGTAVNTPITVQAGHGGNNAAGHGGTGGEVQFLAVGFNLPLDQTTDSAPMSADLITQNIIVHGGDGGSGIKGGNGGVVADSDVVGSIPDDGVVGANGANPEIQIFGGAGGVATSAGKGKGGRGGNVAQVLAENFDVLAAGQGSSILVQGGLGGAAARGGKRR